jgi:Family of unknown function (DUF6445)
MKPAFTVIDEFLPDPDVVAQSAKLAGFGNWTPPTAAVGSGKYEGIGYIGDHAKIIRSIVGSLGAVFPNTMFFRMTTEETERAYIHSDRHHGDWTCITYLSSHVEPSGTALWRHRKFNLLEMPTFEEMKERGIFDEVKRDMVEGGADTWEQIDFVRGLYNRALIFRAPLFHSRFPLDGMKSEAEGRLIHAVHFFRE